MKVLHIIDTLWLGGAQNLLKALFENQQDNKNIFLYPLRTREFNIEIDHRGVIPNPAKSKYSLRPIKTMRRIIKENKIEVLHCHLPRSQVFGYLLKKFYFPEIRLVFHEHGEIFEKYFFYKKILKFISRKADLILCVSQASEDEIKKVLTGKQVKTEVLYNFIDTRKFSKANLPAGKEAERKKLGFGVQDFVVGFAGRLFERKGWKEFVRAAVLLKDKQEIKFLMAGTGDDREEMLEFIKQNKLENNVIYLGYVKDMMWFYSLIDCFVIPSHWEGLPLAQFEARACGLPVIISNGTGLTELAENVLVFRNKDFSDLASKILQLKNDELLRAKMSVLPEMDKEPYSSGIFISKLNSLYNKLI